MSRKKSKVVAKDKTMNIRVDSSLHDKLSRISNETGLSLKFLVEYAYNKTFGEGCNIVLSINSPVDVVSDDVRS